MEQSKTSPIVPLNLPVAQLDLSRDKAGRVTVYDVWRRRRIILTPEEWVRQHFAHMLVSHKGVVAGRIANEVSIELNGTSRRCDTVVYDAAMRPVMIVEYKAPDVAITAGVFDQIARYAMVLRAPFLTVSNGIRHFCCRIDYDSMTYEFLKDIPSYDQMVV